MKKISLVLLTAFCGSFAATATAQKARPVMRPPAEVTPAGRAARSTAQAAATTTRQPLKALPGFTATGLDGKAVATETVARSDHWFLLYTRGNCEPCQKLLVALGNSASTSLRRGAPYVIVVARSGVYGALDATRAKYPMLADATWLEDTTGTAVQALKPTGTPVLYAMHGKRIAWTVPGSLDSPATVEKLARSWMESKDPAPLAQPPATAAAAPGTPAPATK